MKLTTAAFAILIIFLTAGSIFLLSRPPLGSEISLLPAPTPADILVDISGAVLSPGIYSLPSGSRLFEAVEAAGGFADKAYSESLNRAAELRDGDKIVIPFIPEPGAPAPTQASQPASLDLPEAGPAGSPSLGTININTADQAELETLPRIGPVTAQKIIAYREEHGAFRDVEELLQVSGIGPATLEAVREFVSVGD